MCNKRLNQQEIARLSVLNDALSHPIRLQIIQLFLEQGECLCGELVKQLPIAQSTISQHLKKLKAAGLIIGRCEPPKVCYCLQMNILEEYIALNQQFLSVHYEK